MADIGYIALFLAFVAAIYSAITFLWGMRIKDPALIASARNSLVAVFGLVSISVMVLTYALVTHDFQIEYVASYTSRDLSLPYRISALWAGNDGSLLFWAWVLSICAVVVVMPKRDIAEELVPYASSIIMLTEVFFLSLLLFVSNPFHKLPFTPAEGMGLNPLLENPWMFIHPPFHLVGYVGFTVPFAFAIAALMTKRLDDEWIIATRRWTLITWLLLWIGIITGAWWAYTVLGWGGYWAWDPVENAGLMPWLVATAFLHSTMMQRRRNILKAWNLVLIILTFNLTIFGTFLTRSGIFASVHTFAESALGPFFLAFIGVSLSGSLGLLYYRYKELKGEGEIESLVSRESTFLLNNLLLVGATFAIFLGTIFPVISEAVRGVKVTVGPPFFNQVNAPIFLAIILLAGICTLIGWRRASVKNLIRNFLWSLLAALILGIGLFVLGIREWYALVAFALCGFVLSTIFSEWFRGTRARHQMKGDNYLKSFLGLIGANRPRYGGYIVHIAITLIAIGIIGSSFYDVEKEASLRPGESLTINNYSLTYEDMALYETPSKIVFTTTLSVYNQGKLVGKLTPAKYFHKNSGQLMTEVAVHTTLREDLYVILISWDEPGLTAFKVLVNPLVNWIWIGGGVLVLGGLIAFWPERRTKPALRQRTKGRRSQDSAITEAEKEDEEYWHRLEKELTEFTQRGFR